MKRRAEREERVRAAERPEEGVVLTPPGLATRLARALFELADELPARVLDPACGEGALLAACRDEARRRGAAVGLLGIERDAGRARKAREGLGAGPADGVAIETRDALTAAPWPRGAAIVANPPWVSFSGREAGRAVPRPEESAVRGAWPSLHGAFLARIATHAAAERTPAVVLLPASVADHERYGPLRARVTALTRVSAPELLPEGAFPGVSGETLLLRLLPRRSPTTGSDAPWWRLPAADAELLERLAGHPRLPPRSFTDPGVHTGNAAKLLVHPLAPGLAPLREGRDLTAYHLAAPRKSLDTRVERSPGRRFRYGPPERYRRVPVLLRQTASRPIAALHTEPGFFRNSLLACEPPGELAPAFCTAVLNSSVAAAWHRASHREASQPSFPQVKVGHLRRLPFPFRSRADRPDLHDELARRARAEDAAAPEAVAALDALVFEAYGIEPSWWPRVRDIAGPSTAR